MAASGAARRQPTIWEIPDDLWLSKTYSDPPPVVVPVPMLESASLEGQRS
jgi:hypothetical protein